MAMTPRKAAPALDTSKAILNLKEAANFLQIHPDTMREKAASGAIPGIKVGREWRFSRARLEQVVSGGF